MSNELPTPPLSKAEKFKARQSQGGHRSPDYRADGTRTRRGERNHEVRMARWARNYDRLNGAPEGMEDR